jgi:hypothetical protein
MNILFIENCGKLTTEEKQTTSKGGRVKYRNGLAIRDMFLNTPYLAALNFRGNVLLLL